MATCMFTPFSAALAMIGRIMLSAIFIGSVANKLQNYSGTIEQMESAGVPLPQVALPAALLFLILGSITFLLGFKGRMGAMLLFIFLIPVTYYFHQGWSDETEQIAMMKNIAIMGGLMGYIANGTGLWSLERFFKKEKKSG